MIIVAGFVDCSSGVTATSTTCHIAGWTQNTDGLLIQVFCWFTS